jgi:uncharacterized protein YggE
MGYRVTSRVTARVRDLAKAGSIVDGAVTVGGGALRVEALSFSIENDSALVDQAKALAVTQAVGEVRAMASTSGKRLGALSSLSDPVASPGGQQYFGGGGSAAAGNLGSASSSGVDLPLEAGSQQIVSDVTVVYRLA